MSAQTADPLPFADRFEAVARTLPGADLPWLRRLREDGRERYGAAGLPTVKREDWKYTNLNRLRRTGFVPAPPLAAAVVDSVPLGAALSLEADVAVLVNGRFRADLSTLPDPDGGIQVAGLADTLERAPESLEPLLGRLTADREMPLAALNTAFIADGVVIRLARGVTARRPVHVVSIGAAVDQPVLFHPRLLVVAEEGSHACVLESHVGTGDGPYFSNAVVEVALAERATLQHYKLQNEHPAAFHIAATQVELAAGAAYESFVLQLGARLARNEIYAHLGAGHGACHLNGAYLLCGTQHADNTTVIDHAAPGSTSRELYKGVLDDTARGVFQGRILVRKDAQKTDGHQLNRALLLSRGAEIDSKPELEIYADDVKCSHGASAGELDENALFYLRSRGLDEDSARGLLVEAFVGEALETVENEAAQQAFRSMVERWLADRRPGGRGNGDNS